MQGFGGTYVYLILSDYDEFEDNYMRAWSEHASEENSTAIFLGRRKTDSSNFGE